MDLNFKAINRGTYIIANDILIVSNADSSSGGSHDYHLLQVLNKCHEIGFKLNPDKCIFKSMQVLFFGHLVTNDGLKPDPSKIMLLPTCQHLRIRCSFSLQLDYVPHLTDVLAPLCELTVKSIEFE